MKLWGGRFEKGTDELVNDFNSSPFCKRWYKQDIKGKHGARENARQSLVLLTEEESALIVKTLAEILAEIENGTAQFMIDAEDIHMNIETMLIAKIGDTAKNCTPAEAETTRLRWIYECIFATKPTKL